MDRIRLALAMVCAQATVLVAGTAQAQSWPAKPVRLIVAQAAGSSPDLVARLVAEPMSRGLGQLLLVDNRGGGDGMIGMQAVVRSAADGYTIGFGAASTIVTNALTVRTLPYNPERDFASIGIVGMSPFMLAVNLDVKANTLAELVALARAEPKKFAFASPGRRLLPGMVGDMLNIRSGADLLHVPYNGAAGVQDTIAGRTQMTMQGIPAVANPARRGQLRAIAVSSARRLPGLEDVPTMAETYAGFVYVGWFALVAPSGTPTEAVRRLNCELDSALSQADIVQKLRAMGIYPDGAGTPEQMDEFLRSERARWSRTVKDIGIEPE
jgi:tripartite-type tricarboxylate transporter receptor subunit TctC